MTLEEIKRTEWSRLEKGVEYISLKDGKTKSSDSVRLSVKGFWGSNITIPEEVYDPIQPSLNTTFTPILKNKLPESKQGYLKINLYEMTKPDTSTARVYLSDNIDSSELNKGIQMIRGIKGVLEAIYISKEMAKKKYLAEGNEDWEKVLISNPLPSSIEIKFDNKIILPDSYENIQNKIKGEMLWVNEITFPRDLFEKYQSSYYILEYFR